MTALISSIHQKVSAFAGKAHQTVKSHTLTVVYLVVVAAVLIPVGHMVYDYWRPVVVAYKLVVVPSEAPAKAAVRRGP